MTFAVGLSIGVADVLADELRRDGIDPTPVIHHLVETVAPLRSAIASA